MLNHIVQVRDAVPSMTRVRTSLDVLGTEVIEKAAALAEKHGDKMDLELVEKPRCEREVRGRRTVHQHVLVARTLSNDGSRLTKAWLKRAITCGLCRALRFWHRPGEA